MHRILIAEDETRISDFIKKGLQRQGFGVHVVADGLSALTAARSNEFDLLILDLGLPILDGMTVLRELRAEHNPLPVLILSARDTVRDTVSGLESGADDYLRKPFAFDELLARIKLRLRSVGSTPDATAITVGNVTLDLLTRRARVKDAEVELTAREFTLAEYLMTNADQVVSPEQILSAVWGLDFDPGSNVVNVYVRYLRNKLGTNSIETVRGFGFRFVG